MRALEYRADAARRHRVVVFFEYRRSSQRGGHPGHIQFNEQTILAGTAAVAGDDPARQGLVRSGLETAITDQKQLK